MVRLKWETELRLMDIGKIPTDWGEVKLDDFITLESGDYFRFSEFVQSGVRCLKIDNVGFGEVVWDTVTFLPENYSSKYSKLVLNEGDIVIALNRPIIDEKIKIGRLKKEDCPSILYQRVGRILFKNKELQNTYLFFILLTKYFMQQLSSSLVGTDQPYIRNPMFLNIKIPWPPYPEQTHIATVLSWFDNLLCNKKKQNEILEKTAMAIFKKWFIDLKPFKDGEFLNDELKMSSKEWEVRQLVELFNLTKGKKCDIFQRYVNGCMPYLLIETYKTGNVSFWTNEKQPLVEIPDIVVVADGESSGKVLRFQKGILGSTLLMLKPKHYDSDVRHFAYLLLKDMEKELMEHRTGSAIPHLDKDYLTNLEITVPPDPILQKFNLLVEPLFQKIILNNRQIMILTEVMDVLLPLLIFGKLRVEEI